MQFIRLWEVHKNIDNIINNISKNAQIKYIVNIINNDIDSNIISVKYILALLVILKIDLTM